MWTTSWKLVGVRSIRCDQGGAIRKPAFRQARSAAFRKLNVVAGAAETLALRDTCGVEIDVRVEQVGLPPGVDGILGIDVLRGFAAAELDCAAAELRLHRAPYAAAADGVALPMELRRVSAGQLPLVTMRFGDVDCGLVLVDTGSPVTMVTPELAEECLAEYGREPQPGKIGRGNSSQR